MKYNDAITGYSIIIMWHDEFIKWGDDIVMAMKMILYCRVIRPIVNMK
jgi:hypothetical protein